MARPVHELRRPLLLAVSCLLLLLLQVSECSRPPSPSPADHLADADALHHQLLMLDAEARTARPHPRTEAVAGDGRTAAAAAPSSSVSATTSPARAVAAAVVVASSRPRRQTSDPALLVPAGTLLRSKLARRFLAGAGVDEPGSATDGASPSCHSNNPHINCPPAWKQP